MQKQEHLTKPNGRVRIKDAVTHMYEHARAYNEAIVKQQMHDNLGYPLIFVEWDKDHWAYSGEEDRWALESHFELVEENMADSNERNLIQELRALMDSWESDKTEVSPKARNGSDELTYDDILDKATEAARNSDAFVILVASPEEYQGAEIVVPRVYMDSKRKDAALMLEATMADHIAHSMLRLAQEQISGDADEPKS